MKKHFLLYSLITFTFLPPFIFGPLLITYLGYHNQEVISSPVSFSPSTESTFKMDIPTGELERLYSTKETQEISEKISRFKDISSLDLNFIRYNLKFKGNIKIKLILDKKEYLFPVVLFCGRKDSQYSFSETNAIKIRGDELNSLVCGFRTQNTPGTSISIPENFDGKLEGEYGFQLKPDILSKIFLLFITSAAWIGMCSLLFTTVKLMTSLVEEILGLKKRL